MKEIEWIDGDRVKIDPPKKTKKVTGTRFASILGKNKWSTEFEMWLAITKTYEEPFEDTIYTIAGKTIEPKQAQYLKDSYGLELISPTDKYGEDYFNKTHGDFFPESKIFGGMWDYLGVDPETGKVDTVYEMKTTKRVEDWQDDVPEYYGLQAALYAYLIGVDHVVMVASFLEDKDYDHPENFEPSVTNTITIEFNVLEKYPDFGNMLKQVEAWWTEHVETGVSPVFDEKRDADLLKALRTTSVAPDDKEITKIIKEAEKLKESVDKAKEKIKEKEDNLKKLQERIKKYAQAQFTDGDKNVTIEGFKYEWSLSKSNRTSIDKDLLKADGLLKKYEKTTETYTLRVNELKEEEE